MSEAVGRLVAVVDALRQHCPWTRALTHEELTEYLVEEAYEALEAIESGAPEAELRGELGDVLFQVVLHAAIADGRGAFTLDDVAETITAKMLRRNPHVFTPDGRLRPPEELASVTVEQIERQWERIKAEEKRALAADERGATAGSTDEAADPAQSVFAELPAHLPALAAAAKAVDRAARRDPDPLVAERSAAAAPTPGEPGAAAADPLADETALGAHLFELAARARRAGLDPERALRRHLAVRAGRVG